MEEYGAILYWTGTDFDSAKAVDSAPRTKGRKSGGGTAKKNDVNVDGQYVEREDGTVVGGIEFGHMREFLNTLLFDILAAGRATRKLAHLGDYVRGALVYRLEQRYPHLGLCVEHWKALRLIQDRYRFWAVPVHERLINFDDDDAATAAHAATAASGSVPVPPAPPVGDASSAAGNKRTGDDDLGDAERAKRRQILQGVSTVSFIPLVSR
jgi:hypothetical protein